MSEIATDEGPSAPQLSVAAELNAAARCFWSGKRDIVSSILRDPESNQRFQVLLRAQSGKSVRRQRSEHDLALQAASRKPVVRGTQINPRDEVDASERLRSNRAKLALKTRARQLDQARLNLIAEKQRVEDIQAVRIHEIHAQRGRIGGRVSKKDLLTIIIEEVVRKNHNIKESDLFAELRGRSDPDTDEGIISVGLELIEFRSNGKVASAKRSGLKDRLSDAKKRIRTQS